jgi:hypothetical protein
VTLPDSARDLLALPPSRFVAERNALAKALGARGDAAAATVRALRRPVGLAWVMNRLARDRPDDVAALLAAGDRLRRGQRRALAGEGADELRAGEAELRRHARALRDAAAPLLGAKGGAGLSRLELLLRIAASAPAAREALRAGILEREPEAEPIDLSGLAIVEGGAGGRRAPPSKGAAGAEGMEKARERAAARAHDAALRAARAELARADAAARRAEGDAGRAEAAARRAEEAARRAAERAETLRRRADGARAEARDRERAVGALGEAPSGAPTSRRR